MAAARKHGYRNKKQFEAENKARKTSSRCWKLIPSSLLLGKLAFILSATASRNRLSEQNDETIYNTQ